MGHGKLEEVRGCLICKDLNYRVEGMRWDVYWYIVFNRRSLGFFIVRLGLFVDGGGLWVSIDYTWRWKWRLGLA